MQKSHFMDSPHPFLNLSFFLRMQWMLKKNQIRMCAERTKTRCSSFCAFADIDCICTYYVYYLYEYRQLLGLAPGFLPFILLMGSSHLILQCYTTLVFAGGEEAFLSANAFDAKKRSNPATKSCKHSTARIINNTRHNSDVSAEKRIFFYHYKIDFLRFNNICPSIH